ncbi:MAG: response regulator transcription factor [Actinobacteria bacterium]|nr:MAG: response regulator transcription factor [Actinomycetota bacterium]
MDPIRVFIADDHGIVRLALRTLLEAEPDLEVCGEAGDGERTVREVAEVTPDVLLLDMRMGEVNGVEVCRRVKSLAPDVRVLVLTSFDGDEELFGVLSAGANGYLLKDARPEVVVQAVRSVAAGQSVFDSGVAARVIGRRDAPDPAEGLSARELEVLRLMAAGRSNRDIGAALWISETTVKTHVSHILRKLGAADRTQAVVAAAKAGIVEIR